MDFTLSPELEALRSRAKAVAAEGVATHGVHNDSWINGFSKEFSETIAAEGWVGMTWPKEFGGGGRPNIERIIMSEELIGAGAPIAASWFADRQFGPSLFTYGTPDQQAEYLPDMLSGKTTWGIGMSEPDSGSDLASLKTTADLDGDVFVVNGQKIWTSGGALADYIYLICRTDSTGKPHEGVSELIVPTDLPGIEIRTIRDMVDNTHFCEIFFTDVRVPVENLVGVEGQAFRQTMTQLEHERGGIDRLVSNKPLYDHARSIADTSDPRVRNEIATLEAGYHVGRLLVYREALRQAPKGFSAATKVYCTEHEIRVAEFASRVMGAAATLDSQLSRQIAYSPSYKLAGGTSEIMRNILGERVLGLPREPRA
ncbi:MAG: acyl-CoA dehydrogenase [Acidimicrobiales bacterium]|nr:acyl-CoA dehydrogenase [Acidimicrobiales bacterium]RZV45656.1 MAG: acyl-CoA dehydrogenase [Acidimicrobiales bacterium]